MFCIGFVFWFSDSFLYYFLCSFCSFSISKAIAKSFAIASESEKKQQLSLLRKLQKRKQYKRNKEKKMIQKKIKSDKYIKGAIEKNPILDSFIIFSHFGGTNNICISCKLELTKILLLPSKCEIIFVTL